jgi:ABC-type sugar transport system substrate-binding protein
VTPDQKELGRVQGQQFKALLPNGGRLLYVLGGAYASTAVERKNGMMEEIRRARIQVDELNGQWSLDKARDAVYKWLTSMTRQGGEVPDVIGCQNDEMALGAREAVERAAAELGRPALQKVRITGADGLPEGGQRWVEEKKLAATVVVPVTSGPAVELLARAWSARATMPPSTVLPSVSYPALERLSGM